ncbi:MAG: Ni/Fe hydrogenase subunit gamma [Actinomycetia bacterium]|nr:Ni/Fe hydrogenase subunit gamma [Actinomycetes bacterium]MCP5031113.1 Ni/Fe hydrogenase subunit gamma [Actinomycetes bacterium]
MHPETRQAPTPPGPMTPRMYEVVSRRQELADTVTLDLAPLDEGCDPPGAGQFNMLWAFGVGEAPISVAGFEAGTLTHTIRRVGAVSTALVEASPGDQIGVRGPYGTGWGLDQARGRDVLVLAGGLGLAPVRPIITSVLAERPAFGRAVVLIGARSPDTLLYRDEIEEWRGRLDIDIEVTVDSATPEWRGDVGVVTRLVGRAPVDPTNTVAFVCGPEVMMRFSALAVTDLGVAPSAVQLSMERNMHCAIGHCGHCQLGSSFICKDGPVLDWPQVEALLRVRER